MITEETIRGELRKMQESRWRIYYRPYIATLLWVLREARSIRDGEKNETATYPVIFTPDVGDDDGS